MSKYVDVEKILNDKGRATRFPNTSDLYYHESVLQYAPAEDVAPVIHAHWEQKTYFPDGTPAWVCSRCGHPEEVKYSYCNCGARMDEEVEQ